MVENPHFINLKAHIITKRNWGLHPVLRMWTTSSFFHHPRFDLSAHNNNNQSPDAFFRAIRLAGFLLGRHFWALCTVSLFSLGACL